MVRQRGLVGLAGVALGLTAEWVGFGWGDPRHWIPDLAVGWTFIGCGLVGWARRPESRTGPLMAATGFTWFAGSFAQVGVAAVVWLAAHPVYLHRGPLVQLVLTGAVRRPGHHRRPPPGAAGPGPECRRDGIHHDPIRRRDLRPARHRQGLPWRPAGRGRHQQRPLRRPGRGRGLTGGLLYSAGALLLGVALWRAGTLPRWTGPLYAVAVPLISIMGLAVGVAQPVGAVLIIISGA